MPGRRGRGRRLPARRHPHRHSQRRPPADRRGDCPAGWHRRRRRTDRGHRRPSGGDGRAGAGLTTGGAGRPARQPGYPEHKLRVVAALRRRGEVVAVTADGANNAPALKHVDIGVAMGACDTDVAREASVIVLLDDSFASIAAAVRLGRSVYHNIRKFLVYVFSSGTADTVLLLGLAKAEVSLITTVITSWSRSAGRDLAAIPPPPGTLVAAVVRDETPLAAGPGFRLRPGDELLIVSETAGEQEI
ncbi:HAD-IC family P-type ATPase [Phytohabitans houttuyneae]|uniref:HAD-IC family P-type ATPase n=1 Tax=Phytohabitans houttuyneae TaxID=1076126 RepID=UPI003530D349